jgi:hypothetical protein
VIFPQPHEKNDEALARRFLLLTLNMIECARREDREEMKGMLSARDEVLAELEALPEISPAAMKVLNEGLWKNERFLEILGTIQSETVDQIVKLHHGEKSRDTYSKQNHGIEPGSGFEQAG